MRQSRLKAAYAVLVEVLWALVLVLLPLTSLPLLGKIVHGETVNVVSAVPLLLIVLAWFPFNIAKGGTIPKASLPLIGFVLIAAGSCLLAAFGTLHPFKGQTILTRESAGLITLAVGIAFYWITASYVSGEAGLERTLRWIYLGCLLLLLWSGLQGYYVLLKDGHYPQALADLQRLFSPRGLFPDRVTGFAYEPSWVANMLIQLYMPLMWGSIVTRYSAFRFRVFKVPLEAFLLAASALVLVLSTSRVGLLSLLTTTGLVVLVVAYRVGQSVAGNLHGKLKDRLSWFTRSLVVPSGVLVWLAILGAFLLGGYGLVRLAARLDSRLQRVFETQSPPQFTIEYASQLAFAERGVYWISAAAVFEQHPAIGVGLGNAGFYFSDVMPRFGYALPEVVQSLDPGSNIFPNAKSLWLRLLAETGVIGLTFYLVWLLLTLVEALILNTSTNAQSRAVAFAGFLGLIAIITEGFSLDSFALPYYWVLFGLVAAAAAMARRSRTART